MLSVKKVLFLILFFCLFLANQSLAAEPNPSKVTLPNPIGPQTITYQTVLTIGGKVVNGLIGISGAIALLMFVYGSFLWLTSRGEPDKIKKGKEVFIWSTLGLVVIFSSYLMVSFVIESLTRENGLKKAADEQKCIEIAGEKFKICYSGSNDEVVLEKCHESREKEVIACTQTAEK